MVDTASFQDLESDEPEDVPGDYMNTGQTNIQFITQELAVVVETLPTQIMVTVDQYFQLLTDPLSLLDHLHSLGLSRIGDLNFYQYASSYNIEAAVLCHHLFQLIKNRFKILKGSWRGEEDESTPELIKNWDELFFKGVLGKKGFTSGSYRIRLNSENLKLLNEGLYDDIPLPKDVSNELLTKVRGGYKSEITEEMARWTFWLLALRHKLVILVPLEG